jgi:hypothetical protein
MSGESSRPLSINDSSETTPLIMAKDRENHAEEISSFDKDPESRPRPIHANRAVAILGEDRIDLTEEESKRICRKIDKVILPILVWVYFLQILDKSVLGYGAVLGLRDDANLTGDQYSYVSSVSAMAQLGWQPFSSFLIVKVPHRHLMPALVRPPSPFHHRIRPLTFTGPRMGSRPDIHGRLPQLRRSHCHPPLPRPLRSRLSPSLRRDNIPLVPPLGTAISRCALVSSQSLANLSQQTRLSRPACLKCPGMK